MRVWVWLYKDGVLLPDGFTAVGPPEGGGSIPLGPCLIAALESVGCEVCIAVASGEENKEVTYTDVSETPRLWYDYEVQAWAENGYIAKCGHKRKSISCYACDHAGEKADSSHFRG